MSETSATTRSGKRADPLGRFLERQGVVILDGGLATALEARGFELNDHLWSARLLLDDPQAIQQLHCDYLDAGADCIISASYQASFQGLERYRSAHRPLSNADIAALLHRSVQLALQARETFWAEFSLQSADAVQPERLYPLVAASVGSYGAYLADGSEYTGGYGLEPSALLNFHRQRLEVLAESAADLLACETIPSRAEAHALRQLLDESSGIPAWISFSCRDDAHLSDGSLLAEVVAELEGCQRLVAVGVNCTAPQFIPGLIEQLRHVTSLPIVVYPNSGEGYDATHKRWLEATDRSDLAKDGLEWLQAGARLIGGCCRTGPDHIRALRTSLLAR